MRILSFCLTLFWSGSVSAQTAFPCDWQASALYIVEPWEDNSRTFANGDVRVTLLDTIEPAAAAFYLLLLHPPYSEVGGPTCTLVGLDDGLGYAGVYFDELSSSYDPNTGLRFEVPVSIYMPEQSFQNSALVAITVNQANGDVTVVQGPLP